MALASHPVRRRLQQTAVLLPLLALAAHPGCGDDPAPPVHTVVVTHELDVHWELLPHRVSALELSLSAVGEDGAEVHAFNAGGSFGLLDTPGVTYGLAVWRSRQLVSESGAVQVAIPPGSEAAGEPFSGVETVTLGPESGLLDAAVAPESLVALIRGYRVDTDLYESPPAFETDPVLPYDPVDGYTTQGLGIHLSSPVVADGQVSFEVTVRNSLGLADRRDMNAAIPQATTWVWVDYVVVGVRGTGRAVRGEVAYTLSTEAYGQATVHPHAADAEQGVELAGDSSLAQALFGVTAFDLWVNVDAHQDPACVVTQDATNAWDEPVSGPGRYLTSLSARLWDTHYDASSGEGSVRLDLHFSNSSVSKEVGNLCIGAWGEVAMLQFDDPDAVRVAVDPVSFTFEAGVAASQEVVW